MVVSLKEVRFLDRPAARLCAVGVALLTAVPLAVMHRDDLFPPERAAVNADDPVARCLAERGVDIDKMAAEIGRASCRERVCRYVSIPAVAVSLQKKRRTPLIVIQTNNTNIN